MTIDLTDTTTGTIHEALTQARRRMGGPASGTVLTLIIVTSESASNATGSSMATSANSCSKWFWITSRAAPMPS